MDFCYMLFFIAHISQKRQRNVLFFLNFFLCSHAHIHISRNIGIICRVRSTFLSFLFYWLFYPLWTSCLLLNIFHRAFWAMKLNKSVIFIQQIITSARSNNEKAKHSTFKQLNRKGHLFFHFFFYFFFILPTYTYNIFDVRTHITVSMYNCVCMTWRGKGYCADRQ